MRRALRTSVGAECWLSMVLCVCCFSSFGSHYLVLGLRVHVSYPGALRVHGSSGHLERGRRSTCVQISHPRVSRVPFVPWGTRSAQLLFTAGFSVKTYNIEENRMLISLQKGWDGRGVKDFLMTRPETVKASQAL